MSTHTTILRTRGRNGPVRRNLFGPVDREQLQLEYQAALHKDLQEASQRWGFDFISDKPLESSDFKWEGIPGTKVPVLYRSCKPGVEPSDSKRAAGAMVPGRKRMESPQSEKENIPHTPEKRAINLESWQRTPEQGENRALKRKQTNITDFYQAKRRIVWMPLKSE
ncbi:cyclin-dependent kinase inhibitor 1 isoform X2 [Cololabis saira]|nr:cyclin-dependent kinase inhibitor 1 isoform X2 [Cololabis saira]XP_061584478.1 cyclin-dependent kinase inhibitor 1 isoform X2 [Cololabis saira]